MTEKQIEVNKDLNFIISKFVFPGEWSLLFQSLTNEESLLLEKFISIKVGEEIENWLLRNEKKKKEQRKSLEQSGEKLDAAEEETKKGAQEIRNVLDKTDQLIAEVEEWIKSKKKGRKR